jgi:hypothetical protein
MNDRLDRLLTDTRTVYAACLTSFAIGLTFIFVWTPHPWGWEGIDRYHDLSLAIARGQGFPTLVVPWGYPAFLALFYRLFGDHPVVPLVAQAAIGATIPLALYAQTFRALGRRAAVIAAVITGAASFNMVYASTQASDSIGNVIVVVAVLVFVEAERRRDIRWYAGSGALVAVSAQFRPNLILIPGVLACFALWRAKHVRLGISRALAVLAAASLVLLPWIVRNYVLTGLVIPATVHGGAQLWYGSLQTGPNLTSRASNSRSIFETPTFESSSLTGRPLIVEATPSCVDIRPELIEMVLWTDRAPLPKRFAAAGDHAGVYEFHVPTPPLSTVVYYYFDIRWPHRDHPEYGTMPAGGAATPYVFFVTADHIGDLDVHGDLLDVFDVLRLARHIAWGEPLPWADRLDLNGDDVTDVGDLRQAIALLSARGSGPGPRADRTTAQLDVNADALTIRLADGSSIEVPKSGRSLTDARITDGVAGRIVHSTQSFAAIADARDPAVQPPADPCLRPDPPVVNRRFDRAEPQMMRRYLALARDNIARDPLAYLKSCAYRAIRLFVIEGSPDRSTAQQFASSGRLYRLGQAATVIYLVLFVSGASIAVRRRLDVWLFLALIAYVPATICFVLINMRYTVTVQPYMFAFAAVAIEAVLERVRVLRPRAHRRGEAAGASLAAARSAGMAGKTD